MDSWLSVSAATILAQSDLSRAVAENPVSPAVLLDTFDLALSVASLVVLGTAPIARRLLGLGSFLADAPPRPNGIREDSIVIAVFTYLLAGYALLQFTQLALGSDHPMSSLITGSGAHLLGMAVCLRIAAKQFEGGARSLFVPVGRDRPGYPLVMTLLVTLMAIGMTMVVRDLTVSVIDVWSPGYSYTAHPTISALGTDEASPMLRVALWIGAGVVAPIAEELFFRGLLQTFFLNVFRRRGLAILLASLVFGGVHFTQPHAVAALAVLGLFLGYAYERSGTVLVPIVIHSLFNLKTLIWQSIVAS